jgi:hypothetical protein
MDAPKAEAQNTTPPKAGGNAIGLSPEQDGMMSFVYRALQPMADDYNCRRREAYK